MENASFSYCPGWVHYRIKFYLPNALQNKGEYFELVNVVTGKSFDNTTMEKIRSERFIKSFNSEVEFFTKTIFRI